jgi:hypothetical protein
MAASQVVQQAVGNLLAGTLEGVGTADVTVIFGELQTVQQLRPSRVPPVPVFVVIGVVVVVAVTVAVAVQDAHVAVFVHILFSNKAFQEDSLRLLKLKGLQAQHSTPQQQSQ